MHWTTTDMAVGVDLVEAERLWTVQTDAVRLMTSAMIAPTSKAVTRIRTSITDFNAVVVVQITTNVRSSFVSATELQLAVLPAPTLTPITKTTQRAVVEYVNGIGFSDSLQA